MLDRARPGAAPPGDDREPGRGRAGVLVLALRGRRLGGRVYGGLPGGTVAVKPRRGSHAMASEPRATPQPEAPAAPDAVEMPRPTVAPLVLALGLALLAAGVALGLAFLVVGAVVVVVGLGHLDRPAAAGPRTCPRAAGRAGTASPARDGRAGRRGAAAAGHARLPPPPAAGRSSHLRRRQGRHRRRRGDAGARPALGAAQRPRPLVSGQPAGRHGPAGRRQDDRPRAGAVSRVAAAGGARHSRRPCRWSSA